MKRFVIINLVIFAYFFNLSTVYKVNTNPEFLTHYQKAVYTGFLAIDLSDDFEDGNITNWTESTASRWAASSESSINGTYSLHHVYDNSGSDEDFITKDISTINLGSETKVWRFQVRYDNAPSSSNNWSVFLFSDKADLSNNPSGYAVGVDYATSDDFLKLWKVDAGSETAIITTDIDWDEISDKSIPYGIEVSRTISGDWELKVDFNGGFDYLISKGTANNTDITTANYFGIFYDYTSSKDRLLWIDDIYIGAAIPDNETPVLKTMDVLSPTKIKLTYNEALDETTAETVSNYVVNKSFGSPTTATLNATDARIVELDFSSSFADDEVYTLTVNGVKDLNSNTISNSDHNFSYTHIAVSNIEFIDNKNINVYFNKDVETTSAETVTNYNINSSIQPTSATVDGSNKKLVHLVFNETFESKIDYTFEISNVDDQIGNTVYTKSFSLYVAGEDEIVVNELMVDISPVPDVLPEGEYIELINNTSKEIQLQNYTYQLGNNSPVTIPRTILSSNGFVIICSSGKSSEFDSYGTTIGNLDEGDLSSTGKEIIIKNSFGEVIESITYSPEWYYDDEKDNGGWSMERIDPTNYCNQPHNWKVTTDYRGGTPGATNSIYASNPDNKKPEIDSVQYISSKKLDVYLNEKIDNTSATSLDNYILNSTINPTSANIDTENKKLIHLVFSDNFSDGSNEIEISAIQDLCGNVMDSYTYIFEYKYIEPINIETKSENQILIEFTDFVEETSGENTINYTINNSIGNPSIVEIDNNQKTLLHLQLASDMVANTEYTIDINNVQDTESNTIISKSLSFTYHPIQEYDVVLTEIMADVNPVPAGLFAGEYIELYNQTNYQLWYSDWILQFDDEADKTFPRGYINPGEYIIICTEGNSEHFSQYATTIDLLSSADLTSTGKKVNLKSGSTLIDEVNYTDTWHTNDKKTGGWSLEKIDPNRNCSQNGNWTSSTDNRGGTPGIINSVNATNVDNEKPVLDTIIYYTSKKIDIYFNEAISEASANNLSNYTLNSTINPTNATINTQEHNIIRLEFADNFIEGTNEITIKSLSDNCSNLMENYTGTFNYNKFELIDIEPIDNKTIKLYFSDNVLKSNAIKTTNYLIDNEIGNPKNAIVENSDSSIIVLSFESVLTSDFEYNITIQNIKDFEENIAETQDISFVYHPINLHDVIITEIMSDISPTPYSLPEAEYIEIFNRSNYKLWYSDWIFQSEGGSEKTFPTGYINSGEYIIICTEGNKEEFEQYGKTIDLLSSTDLSATGKKISIKSALTTIDEIEYSNTWHTNDKKTGGWSLEKIDPNRNCSQNGNWTSSIDTKGGSPGLINSVNDENLDNTKPAIDTIVILTSKKADLYFTEKISTESAAILNNYTLNKDIHPFNAKIDEDNPLIIHLNFTENFNNGLNKLDVKNLPDLCGNIIDDYSNEFNYDYIKFIEAQIVSANQILIRFNHEVNKTSALELTNYTINNQFGNPRLAIVNTDNSKEIIIEYEQDFTADTQFTLTVENIADLEENIAETVTIDFIYHPIQKHDVIINEIMADVNPVPVGLPAAEYVEIYNRSNYRINLSDFKFISEDAERKFPEIYIEPQTYLILCNSNITEQMSQFGNVVGNLKENDLSSTGKLLSLQYKNTIIDEVKYSDSWHSEDKKTGGWSLEKVDSDQNCSHIDNWESSVDSKSGTPGSQNSVYRSNPDNSKPIVDSLIIRDSKNILVFFSEPVQEEHCLKKENFTLNNVLNPVFLDFIDANQQILQVAFDTNFNEGDNLLLINSLYDNCLNLSENIEVVFEYTFIYIKEIEIISSKQLKVEFSEKPNSYTSTLIDNYMVNNNIGNPVTVIADTENPNVVYLLFDYEFADGLENILTVSGIQDAQQNIIETVEFKFIYNYIEESELVINELLFNPSTGGVDFVELYSLSENPIILKNLQLVRLDYDTEEVIDYTYISSDKKLMSNSFAVICSDSLIVQEHYFADEAALFIQDKSTPNFPDDKGIIQLYNNENVLIDEFKYTDDMHFNLISDVNGVSLERINPLKPSNEESNWHSAAQTVGYATPGYKNSQFVEFATQQKNSEVNLEYELFSPDNDGYNDELFINFNFAEAGQNVKIEIYDSKGYPIRKLQNVELTANDAIVSWDGTDEAGDKAPMGIYIIYIETFNESGSVNRYKLSCVLAGKKR